MSRQTTPGGVFAIELERTEIDEVQGLELRWLRVGASFRWYGAPVRLDGPPSVLPLCATQEHNQLQTRARAVAERLSGVMPTVVPRAGAQMLPSQGLVMTDGSRVFTARIVEHGSSHLFVFEHGLPEQGRPCWIIECNVSVPGPEPRAQDVICFSSDTLLATPQGDRPIGELAAGDRIVTRDNGPKKILWKGQTALSGTALRQHPHLRPVRVRQSAFLEDLPTEDLCVSPAHRILLTGPRAQALFGCDEVLVRARDLIDFQTVTVDLALHGVTYIHLLLDSHQIIFANGVPTESFHPALAPASALRRHAHELRRIAPEWVAEPDRYGPTARRCLAAGEAALLAA